VNGPRLSETAYAVCLGFVFLIPLAAAGLALMNTGLGRARSAAHSALSALCVVGVAALCFFAFGFALEGFLDQPAHTFAIQGKPWNWLGAGSPFLRGVHFDGSPEPLAALFGLFAASLAAIIPLGSGSDRWRLGAICASTAILSSWTFPLFAHWVWGGGWLAQLGRNYGLGQGFLDTGGAASIHVVGGLSALSIAWLLGPRRGKYTSERMPAAIPGHNVVLVVFGCFLAWLGWIGLNASGALLFAGMELGRLPLVAINTTLSAAAASLTAALITRLRFGKPDASLCANGWTAGLVASSAATALFRPLAAALIGTIAGAMIVYTVEWLELYLTIDDPSGAVSVHALAGIWGVMAAGLFASPVAGANAANQWLAQLDGVATLVGFILPLAYGLNWLLNRFYALRVAPEGERQGLDLYELGAGAYPEFTSHNEDLWQR